MAPAETVTGMLTEFDATSNSQLVKVTGTGFTADDTANTQLFIDGIVQETVSVTAEEATFKIIDMASSTSDNVKVYFASGLPTGYDSFTSITITPTFHSVTPSTASAGGNKFLVQGTGFGANTAELDLLHVESGNNLCFQIEAVSYGEFKCLSV